MYITLHSQSSNWPSLILYDHTQFLLDFLHRKNNSLSKDDIVNLQRFAFESGYDWFFLDRRKINDYIRALQDDATSRFHASIEKLLLKSPLVKDEYYYAKRFISQVFTYRFERNNNTTVNRFLTNVRFRITTDRDARIEILNNISSINNLFSQVCQRLNIT